MAFTLPDPAASPDRALAEHESLTFNQLVASA